MRRMRLACVVAAFALIACGPNKGGSGNGDAAGTGSGTGTGTGGTPDAFDGMYSDFPSDPVIDTGAPANSGGLFGDPANGGAAGPCLTEPEIGTLFPKNWLRPRFSVAPVGTENLFEIRISAPNQKNTLVVYTKSTSWKMPADMWIALSAHTIDLPMTVSVRGATLTGATLSSGPDHGTTGEVRIAPADAPGAIVYWTTSGGTALKGFHVGDENVTPVYVASGAVKCVGCHTSTPDGTYVAFSQSAAVDDGRPASLGMTTADGTSKAPPFLSASAKTLMARTQQEQPTFSPLHWKDGDHVALSLLDPSGATNTGKDDIIWTDLEAASGAQGTGWGIVKRDGDSGAAASASFAHTADTILYVSTAMDTVANDWVNSGVSVTHGNIMTVPYNARAGGTAKAVDGAATSQYNEYYPAYSPDDRLIAFNRINDGLYSYDNRDQGEVFVIPAGGGNAQRLVANDPLACAKAGTSPGITNTWPKWAPAVAAAGGKKYYWLTFSSTRGKGLPQLYVTAVVDDNGTLKTYPALYLWNQPALEKNHTPAWDNFVIPVN
jgi:WD40-like Beta Propeller Repeat